MVVVLNHCLVTIYLPGRGDPTSLVGIPLLGSFSLVWVFHPGPRDLRTDRNLTWSGDISALPGSLFRYVFRERWTGKLRERESWVSTSLVRGISRWPA